MEDLIRRLRATGGKGQGGKLKWQAADEIERLKAEWQPIETAPKDGTVVLGINDDWFSDGAPVRCRFVDGAWEAERMVSTLGRSISIPDPTHWKPATVE